MKFTCAPWPCLSAGPPEDDGHLLTAPAGESKDVAHGRSFEPRWQNRLRYWQSSALPSSPSFQVEHGPIKKRKQSSLSSARYLFFFFIPVKVLLARFECRGISRPPLNRDERKRGRQREEVTNCATDAVQYWVVLQELHGRVFFYIIKNDNWGILNEKQVAVKTFKSCFKNLFFTSDRFLARVQLNNTTHHSLSPGSDVCHRKPWAVDWTGSEKKK